MPKPLYASGFLYSLKTNQILLLSAPQKDNLVSLWSTLGGKVRDGEETQTAFQRIIKELLNITLEAKQIHPVYDYFHDRLDTTNYVFYGEVKSPKIVDLLKETAFSWHAFDKIIKLLFATHTKQDVIVGERVINFRRRLSQNLQ